MLLAVDVGNTNVVFALFDGRTIKGSSRQNKLTVSKFKTRIAVR